MSKAPDKIYVGDYDIVTTCGIYSLKLEDDSEIEYIRKEALLEWAKGIANDAEHSLAYRGAFRDLIDKINSL